MADYISKYETGAAVDAALDLAMSALQPETGKGLSTNDYTTAEKTKLAGIAEGAEVNEIEGIKVNSSTVNPDVNKVVNITVPTTAADISALPDTTKYAAALSLTINNSTFVVTGQLKDQNGDNLGTAQTIDLPLESVVVGGSYNSQTKKVVLTLQNGNTIEFSVADLVSGLQTELSTSNKLNPAFIEYDSTHRAVSDTEKSMWNSKQNALSSTQLDAVNSGIDSTKVAQIETNKDNISKDEAALVALVDGGAKNIFDPTVVPQTATRNGVTITRTENGIHVSGTVTATGDTAIANNIGLVIPSDGYHFYAKTTAPNLVIWMEYKVNGSSVYSPITRDVLNSGYVLNYIYFKSLPGGVPFDVDVDLMLCTAESYAISTTFVPYRPSYQELYEMVKALQANQ